MHKQTVRKRRSGFVNYFARFKGEKSWVDWTADTAHVWLTYYLTDQQTAVEPISVHVQEQIHFQLPYFCQYSEATDWDLLKFKVAFPWSPSAGCCLEIRGQSHQPGSTWQRRPTARERRRKLLFFLIHFRLSEGARIHTGATDVDAD